MTGCVPKAVPAAADDDGWVEIPNCVAVPAVGDNVGAVPPVPAAVSVGELDAAVSSFPLSTLCATSVTEAEPPLKTTGVPVPKAVPLTVGCEPSGPLANPPKMMPGVPATLTS